MEQGRYKEAERWAIRDESLTESRNQRKRRIKHRGALEQSRLVERSLITNVASNVTRGYIWKQCSTFLTISCNQPFVVKFVIWQWKHKGLVLLNTENISYIASIIFLCAETVCTFQQLWPHAPRIIWLVAWCKVRRKSFDAFLPQIKGPS